jgi:F5/8 type C domain-containing protein/fibronectin type III domain protein
MNVHPRLSQLAVQVVVCLLFLGSVGCGPQEIAGEPGEGGVETLSAQLDGPLPPPTSLIARPRPGGVDLSWPAVSGATGYRIYSGTSSGNYSSIFQYSATNSLTDQRAGVQRYYIVKSVNISSIGSLGASPEATATGWVNLARGRPAIQATDCEPGRGSAGLAVDGNTDGNYGNNSVSCAASVNGSLPQWQVDLGASKSVYEIHVYNRTDCCSDELADFDVLTSNDPTSSPTNWSSNAYVPGPVGSLATINMVGVTARHVMIRKRTTSRLMMAEVQVWGGTEDNTSPTVPGGLTATALSSTSIELSWTYSNDNVGVKRYTLQRSKDSTCTSWSIITYSMDTTYTNTGRTPNTTYCYRILAEDYAQNISLWSSAVTVTTPR